MLRIPELSTFGWQQSVISLGDNTPPVSPSTGDRYVIGGSPTGDWVGHSKSVTYWDGSLWKFDIPVKGWLLWVEDENKYYYYNGANWAILPYQATLSSVTALFDIRWSITTLQYKTINLLTGAESNWTDVPTA